MAVYTPSFSHVFTGTIWKLVADSEKGLLFVETRDGELRKVFFHAISIETKNVLWSGQSVLDPWWSSLKVAMNGCVLIVKFNDPEMPEQRGFAVLDGITGKIKWGKEDAQVMHTQTDGLIISEASGEDSSYARLDWNTGNVLQEISLKEMFSTFNKKAQQSELVGYPFHFEEENSFFTKIQEYIEIIAKHKAVRVIEYLEKGDKVLISYYIYEEEKLANYMIVADEKGEILVHEKLRDALTGIGIDTFFVLKDQLIVVKNNNELQAYVVK